MCPTNRPETDEQREEAQRVSLIVKEIIKFVVYLNFLDHGHLTKA